MKRALVHGAFVFLCTHAHTHTLTEICFCTNVCVCHKKLLSVEVHFTRRHMHACARARAPGRLGSERCSPLLAAAQAQERREFCQAAAQQCTGVSGGGSEGAGPVEVDISCAAHTARGEWWCQGVGLQLAASLRVCVCVHTRACLCARLRPLQ